MFVALGIALAAFIANEDVQPARNPQSNFVRLLSLIPDTPETRVDLFMIDYDLLFDSQNVKRPEATQSTAQDQQLEESLESSWRVHGNSALAFGYPGSLGVLSGLDAYSRALPTTDAFGYGLADIDGYAYGGRDPSGYEAVVGRFASARVDSRISQCADCGETPTKVAYDGTTFYAWGDDFKRSLTQRLKAPLDEFGVGGRLAGSSTYVIRTEWSLGMQQMLDASTDKVSSLADDPDVVTIARALDSIGAVSAFVSYCTWSWPRVVDYWRASVAQDDDLIRLVRQSSGDEAADAAKKPVTDFLNSLVQTEPPAGLLLAYQAYSVASGIRNGEPFTALLLLQSTPDQAKENASLLRSRLASTVTGYGRPWPDASKVDLVVSGRIVTAIFPRAVSPDELLYSVNLLAFQ